MDSNTLTNVCPDNGTGPTVPVPEPSSLALVGVAGLGLLMSRKSPRRIGRLRLDPAKT